VARYDITEKLSGAKLSEALKEFVTLVIREHKTKQFDKIIKEYESYAKKKEGIVNIDIISARELETKLLNKIMHIFGKNVEAEVTVDESILGGIKIKTEDKILDGSLKTQLLKLKESII
jgi:F-type H+-transporting ATPase subunit delta